MITKLLNPEGCPAAYLGYLDLAGGPKLSGRRGRPRQPFFFSEN